VPLGVTPNVVVTGPAGFAHSLAATTTITGLTPGSYSVAASTIETDNARFAPQPAQQNVELTAGNTGAANVTYALASGVLQLEVSGLPGERDAAVTITGPNEYVRRVTRSETLSRLAPGVYVVSAASVIVDGDGYTASDMPRAIDIAASPSPFLVAVAYTIATGRLQVHANGLPQGATAQFQVSGPAGFNQTATAGQVLLGLTPGTYTVTATNVVMGTNTYTPGPSSVAVVVVPSLVAAQANVAYTLSTGPGGGPSGPLNLTIDNVYITQAVQSYSGDVPLVAGRDGLVRVFVKASTTNSAQPQVRVRLYNGAGLLHTLTLNSPTPAVPTVTDDATLNSAWHAVVAGAYIQPGLRVLADVDPSNSVNEGSELDNAWPASGTAAAMVVRNVPTFNVRFVPVRQSNDATGNVSTGNVANYLSDLRRMYPIGAIDADVRATYTTSAPLLQANDANGAWSVLLSEVNALRAIDGSSRYYYGVVKTGYTSGVAGMGYLGAPAAIGWDHLPSGADVLAHELGHNWGRYHSPCGGAGSPDPSYPYAGGKIGVSGFDLTTMLFKAPSLADVMGYCSSPWVSDYTYKGIMSYRETHPLVTTAAALGTRASAPEPGVLVWGRVTRREVILEPAFDVVARPLPPQRPGAHRVEGRADDGTVLFSYGFDGDAIDHANPDDRHFAFVVPQSALRGRQLSALRLTARGHNAEVRSSAVAQGVVAARDILRVRRASGRRTTLRWSAPELRAVLVRDVRSGDILAFARGGSATFESAGSEVELILSDGLRSRVERRRLR
jgi:hypothetical protein